MEHRTKIMVGLAIILLFSMACNLLQAILPAEEDTPEIVEAPDEAEPAEDTQPEEDPAASEPEEEPTQLPQVEQPVSAGPFAVFVGDTSITYYSEQDMAVQTVNLNGFVVSAVPSPVGAKIAIMRAEKQDQTGMLWFDLLDLATGQLATITPLANDQTVLSDWETAELGEPPREANFATTLSEPVWRPDGTAVVFISAHQGLSARPYAYHLNSAQIVDLSLGGEAHYFAPSISPDGEYIAVASTTSFGTGAGLAMDAYSVARVSGGEARLIEDVSDASSVLTRGWLDDQTVVFSVGDSIAGAKNLRAVNIHTGNFMQITSPNDYVDNVAVGPDTGMVLFTSMMGELAEYTEGETITKNALFSWNIGMQEYEEINDRVTWGSFVEWNPQTMCFYVDTYTGGQEADFIQPYTSAGTVNEMTCRPLAANVKNIPEFSNSLDYFAWTVSQYDASAPAGLYVQGFTENREVHLIDISVPFAWHPDSDLLTFAQERRVYQAAAPDFLLTQVLETNENITDVFWVAP